MPIRLFWCVGVGDRGSLEREATRPVYEEPRVCLGLGHPVIRGHWQHQVRCNGLRCDPDVIPSARNHFDSCCLVLSTGSLCQHVIAKCSIKFVNFGDGQISMPVGDVCMHIISRV